MHRYHMDRPHEKPIRSVADCFKNPLQEYIIPIYDKYIGNPKKKPQIPRSSQYDMSEMGGRYHMGMNKHHRYYRGQFDEDMEMQYYLNDVQKKLERGNERINIKVAQEAIWNTINKEMFQMNAIRQAATLKLNAVKKSNQNIQPFPTDDISQTVTKRMQSFQLSRQLRQHIGIFSALKNTRRENQALVKGTKEKQLELVKKYFLQLLSNPTANCFIAQYNNLEKKIKQLALKIRQREMFKLRKVQKFGYGQQSIYDIKIRKCHAQIAFEETQDRIYRDYDFDTAYTEKVDKKTLSTLNEGQWVDNKVIVNIIEYLKNFEAVQKNQVYLFNHSQSSYIAGGHFNKEIMLTNYDRVIFLINQNNQHWYVMALFNKTRKVVVYDSMHSNSRPYSEMFNAIQNRIKQQFQLNKKNFQSYSLVNTYNTVSQKNGSDCGVCSVINIMFIFDKKTLENHVIQYDYEIVANLRYALYLMLGYFGYCRAYKRKIRKDYFSFLIRNTIYSKLVLRGQLAVKQKANKK